MGFRTVHINNHLYFVTGTITHWLPVFNIQVYRNIILNSWSWHRRMRRFMIFAFVVMPDHVHWISYPCSPYTMNHNIWSFASFTAHEILNAANKYQHQAILKKFSEQAVGKKKHRIWQDFQAKNIFSDHYLFQKMEYIHNNPIKKFPQKYHLRTNYPYSSARYYDLGLQPIIDIDNIYDFMEKLN